jgi:ADP-heptose:LPS heptosyltransferase
VLVLRPGALGDTLLALPALRALHRAGRPVTLAAHGAAARFLEAAREVERGLAFEDPSLAWLFTGPPSARNEGVVAWMSAAPPGLPSHGLVAASRPPKMDRHCARYLLETLAPLGIDLACDDRPLNVLPRTTDAVLIHPGSGSAAKNWSPERFAAVIRTLERRVCLIVGEADVPAASHVEACLGVRLERLERASLAELASRLAGCHAYLGNDSGVSHLAGLCGARAFILFGPTDPTVWRPLGPRVDVLPFETSPTHLGHRLDVS